MHFDCWDEGYVEIEKHKEHPKYNELDLKEAFCIGVPFVVYDDLDGLLLEKIQIIAIHQRPNQADFLIALDFIQIDVVELDLTLIVIIFVFNMAI